MSYTEDRIKDLEEEKNKLLLSVGRLMMTVTDAQNNICQAYERIKVINYELDDLKEE